MSFVLLLVSIPVVLLVAYVLYQIPIASYLQRKHFRRYPNVWVNPNPDIITGDATYI